MEKRPTELNTEKPAKPKTHTTIGEDEQRSPFFPQNPNATACKGEGINGISPKHVGKREARPTPGETELSQREQHPNCSPFDGTEKK
ncbi:hypothetical protein RJT34_17364 [Clitoria ternatea]|uniref:Uncharacterized protein n=1 Tax=Clitoria ternatea TaxID=43366 RepID=A0AAN9J8U8_CLITE